MTENLSDVLTVWSTHMTNSKAYLCSGCVPPYHLTTTPKLSPFYMQAYQAHLSGPQGKIHVWLKKPSHLQHENLIRTRRTKT